MKIIVWLGACLFCPLVTLAQFTVSGRVTDSATQQPLPGATVQLEGAGTTTNTEGYFEIINVSSGAKSVTVSYVGYQASRQRLQVNQNISLTFSLQVVAHQAEEVLVSATRANEKTATTFTDISRQQIEDRNFGQDLPYLLQQTPSVVVTSDAGAGVGYTGIRIRGSDITRINVTINGIPVNEAESHAVYFVDMPDLASSVENIQVQRGVGTSTNGASAFGASLNIKTLDLNPEAYAQADNAVGSYNTRRHTLRFGTGLIKDKFAFDGRLSSVKSDGYIDRAFSDLKSYYFSGGYFGKKTLLKYVMFSGKEQTYQAWNGIPEARLRNNPEGMQTYIANNGLVPSEAANLVNSGSRTYNAFAYENQTDNYQQDYYQLHFGHELSKHWNLNAALFYTKGGGYYEEFKYADDFYGKGYFSAYGLPNVVIGGETLEKSDLVRRRWLKTNLYGGTYSGVFTNNALRLTLGGSVTGYRGFHFDELTWAQLSPVNITPYRYHEDNARKHDLNFYTKAEYGITAKLSFFGDLQYRQVGYTFVGFNQDLASADQTVAYHFINPKAGLTYAFTPAQALYASYAVANREPVRDDFKDSSPTSRPKPEQLQDLELGYRFTRANAVLGNKNLNYSVNANYYYMRYQDQLVLTGKVNDVGEYTRTNVANSYRSGVELAAAADWNRFLTASIAVNLSRNKIKNFTEYLDDYENGGQVTNNFKETDIAYSPDKVISGELGFQPVKGLRATVIQRVIGSQFLGNTSNKARMLDAYHVTDLRLNYSVQARSFFKAIELSALVNNLFSEEYEANGYTFSYLYGGLITENFYYPQAPRNFMVAVGLKF